MSHIYSREYKKKINRRRFLKKAGVGAAGMIGLPYIVPLSVLGANGTVVPSEKIVMGFIGVGSMGGGHLRTFLGYNDVQAVAVCDLREMFRQKAKNRIDEHYGDKGCSTYDDFREILARTDIDAVTVVTPDHWHSLIGLEAARNRKDMYYEKPLSMSVTEDKALRDTINRYGVVFQFGTQQRSDNRFRLACELVRNKRIGKLHTIIVSSHPSMNCENQPTEPTPDAWAGPMVTLLVSAVRLAGDGDTGDVDVHLRLFAWRAERRVGDSSCRYRAVGQWNRP